MATIFDERTAAARRFYTGMAAAFVVIAFGSFVPSYWSKLATGSFSGAPVLHVHGLVFSLWTLFFFFQTSLVAAGRVLDHRQWGLAGIAIATAMVFTAVLAAINTMQLGDATGMGDAARRFAVVPLTGIIVFAGFFAAAIARNGNKEAHKRLMILAMIPVMQAAVARVFILLFAPPGATPGPPPVFVTVPPGLTVDLLAVVAMLYDWRTRGRPHPVYLTGLPIIVAVQVLVVPFSATATWMSIARGVQSLAG